MNMPERQDRNVARILSHGDDKEWEDRHTGAVFTVAEIRGMIQGIDGPQKADEWLGRFVEPGSVNRFALEQEPGQLSHADIDKAYARYMVRMRSMFDALLKTAFFEAVTLLNGRGAVGNEQMNLTSNALKAIQDAAYSICEAIDKVSDTVDVVIATDQGEGDQALYIDGEMVASDVAIYGCDIESALDGRSGRVRACTVAYEGSDKQMPWPDDFDKCKVVHE